MQKRLIEHKSLKNTKMRKCFVIKLKIEVCLVWNSLHKFDERLPKTHGGGQPSATTQLFHQNLTNDAASVALILAGKLSSCLKKSVQ